MFEASGKCASFLPTISLQSTLVAKQKESYFLLLTCVITNVEIHFLFILIIGEVAHIAVTVGISGVGTRAEGKTIR